MMNDVLQHFELKVQVQYPNYISLKYIYIHKYKHIFIFIILVHNSKLHIIIFQYSY